MSVEMIGEANRRIDRLEREHERLQHAVTDLVISTQRIGDLVEAQSKNTPKLDFLITEINAVKTELSNTKLVQKGFLWLAGIIGSSAITIAMAFVFGGR